MPKSILIACLTAVAIIGLCPITISADENSPNDLFAPVFVNRPQGAMYFSHCDTARYTFQAVSAATGMPSPFVRYRIVSGPGVIDSVTGEWKRSPTSNPDSMVTFEVEIAAREFSLETEGLQNCRALVHHENRLPQIYVYNQPNPIRISAEEPALIGLRLYESDRCDPESIAIVSVTPEFSGTVSIEGDGYDWMLTIYAAPADSGKLFTITLAATDGFGTTTAQVRVQVLPIPFYSVRIANLWNQLQGVMADVPVLLERKPPDIGLGGFDLLFAYDATALSFQSATPDSSELYRQCKWEYFTYRYGANGNCSGGCPSGLVRVVGIAETNNGDIHPRCGTENLPELPAEMFRLRFLVSIDRNWECAWLPIRFFFVDCADNSLSTADGKRLIVADSVFERFGGSYVSVTQPNPVLPGYNGLPNSCLLYSGKTSVERGVHLYGGGIDVVCADSIDARCDHNFDVLPWPDISDYVILSNYFQYGLDSASLVNAFGFSCLDFNSDGYAMTLADLVTLGHILGGRALPYPQIDSSAFPARFTRGAGNPAQWFLSAVDSLGAVLLKFEGGADVVVADTSIARVSNSDPNYTRVLIAAKRVESALAIRSGFLVEASKNGSPATLLQAAASTHSGGIAQVIIDAPSDVNDPTSSLPVDFALYQNYPNPFNPSTTISFDIPHPADVTLEIVNILGQVVWSSQTYFGVGRHEIVWDGVGTSGAPVSSGVYYYRLRAGDVAETRKMMLLK